MKKLILSSKKFNLLKRMGMGFKAIACMLCNKTPDAKDMFEAIYSIGKDPWKYEQSEYEIEKYASTLDTLSGRSYNRALEVGCSEGVFTGMLSEFARDIVAVDISDTAVKRASQKNSHIDNIEFRCLNIEETPPGGKFDLIICSEVLYYLNDAQRIRHVADRFSEWLISGGHLLLVHMRRTTDDDSGFPPPPLGYPSMGANSVHKIFDNIPQLKTIKEEKKPLYAIKMIERV